MPQSSQRHFLFLHFSVLLFGASGLFGKLIVGGATLTVFGRTSFAAVALLLFSVLTRRSLRVDARSAGGLALCGVLLAVHWWTFFHAIAVSSVAIGLLGFASFPLFVAGLESWLDRRPLPPAERWMVALVTLGLVLVTPSFDWRDQATQGLAWAILSGALFALLAIANRRLSQLGAVRVALWQNGVAALMLAPLGLPVLLAASPDQWLIVAVLGVVFTALAHCLFIASLQTVPARTAAVIAALEPVYGIALAWLLFSEIPGLRMLAGGAVILAVTTWVTLRRAD